MASRILPHLTLKRRDRLIAWCVVPNHVHVLFQAFPGHPIGKVVHSWKTFTAREINKLHGQSGPLWQEDDFDTFMRDDAVVGRLQMASAG